MRFGGAWTIQSSSENMTGCLRIIRKLNESQTTYNNYGQFLPTEYDRIIEHVDLDLEECSGKKHRANCHWPCVFKNSLCLGKLKHTSKGYNFPISFQTSCRLNDVEPVAKKTPVKFRKSQKGYPWNSRFLSQHIPSSHTQLKAFSCDLGKSQRMISDDVDRW